MKFAANILKMVYTARIWHVNKPTDGGNIQLSHFRASEETLRELQENGNSKHANGMAFI